MKDRCKDTQVIDISNTNKWVFLKKINLYVIAC
jgi:hypothetical protein